MAKKRGPKKKPGKKRMGAARSSASPWTLAAGALVGGLAVALLDETALTKIKSTYRGGAEAGVGALAIWKVKHPFFRGMGIGSLVYGGIRLASGMGMMTLNGVGCAPKQMGGFRDVAAIGAAGQGALKRFPQPQSVGSPRTRMTGQAARMSVLAAGSQ